MWKVFPCHDIIRIFENNYHVNTLRLRQNGRHFPDNIFKCIFLNENLWIAIKIALKFVPMGPINNIPALVLIMAWHWPGDKPISEPMMVSLLMHICITQPQWLHKRIDHCQTGTLKQYSVASFGCISYSCWGYGRPFSGDIQWHFVHTVSTTATPSSHRGDIYRNLISFSM